MKIHNIVYGGFAETDDDQAQALIDSGEWEAVDAPKRRGRPPKTEE